MDLHELRKRMINESEKLIPVHGGYRKLKSIQVAQLAYDVTVLFCDEYQIIYL